MAVRRISPTITHAYLRASDVHLVDPGNVYIYVGGTEDGPNLRYNKNTSKWQFSNNGTTWSDMGTGGVSGSFDDKEVERLESQVNSGSAHTIPNSKTYTPGYGQNMDVYFNGQLLQAHLVNEERDYLESTTTAVKFAFDVPVGSYLAYIIRQ